MDPSQRRLPIISTFLKSGWRLHRPPGVQDVGDEEVGPNLCDPEATGFLTRAVREMEIWTIWRRFQRNLDRSQGSSSIFRNSIVLQGPLEVQPFMVAMTNGCGRKTKIDTVYWLIYRKFWRVILSVSKSLFFFFHFWNRRCNFYLFALFFSNAVTFSVSRIRNTVCLCSQCSMHMFSFVFLHSNGKAVLFYHVQKVEMWSNKWYSFDLFSSVLEVLLGFLTL